MDKKDKIVEILESWENDNRHYFNSISESDYENIAYEIVKLFAIPIVVGQSKQLVCKGRCDHGYKDEFGNELFCSIKEEKAN